MADLLVVRLQALYNTRDAEVVVPFGAVQRPERKQKHTLRLNSDASITSWLQQD